MANKTTAHWNGDDLMIAWFGYAHPNDERSARWTGKRLIFEGLSESKGWELKEKPTAERALELIVIWQGQGR